MPDAPAHRTEAQASDLPGLSVAPAAEAVAGGVRAATTAPRRRAMGEADLVAGVLAGDRAVLARAISLIESRNPAHASIAQRVLTGVLLRTGRATRIGITGVPGVGKSTFIEALGTQLTGRSHRVAVLAVDPSSGLSGGSVLGDKTRMPRLATDANAFVRPSPSSGTLGGVARRTRETMLLCEAAGFDVVLVETVGVGQSETTVSGMTDLFLALMLPGAGDELQGIKRGLLELVDVIAVNKADGDNAERAALAKAEYEAATRVMRPHADGWVAPVHLCSAKTGVGIDELWAAVSGRVETLRASGALESKRRAQLLEWTRSMVADGVHRLLEVHDDVRAAQDEVERAVLAGELAPSVAAARVLDALQTAVVAHQNTETTGGPEA